jgi:hypothetical protein
MKNHDWIFLAILGVAVYVWAKMQPLASTAIAPGDTAPGGGLLGLPPGLPSGQAALNVAAGYNADGSPIINPLDAGNAGNYLPSTPLGIGYTDLAPDQQSSLTFDDGLINDSSDQGDYGMAVLPSVQTVPFVS